MTLQALLLDLGDTLVHGDRVIDGVPDALRALAAIRSPAGAALPLALVSDYTMPAPGAPASEVTRLFDEYVARVRAYGLLPFFEPVDRRITLSTQAGARKPDARIFTMALERLGLAPSLDSAMFITEDAGHVAACRALGMTCWQFGVDFESWSVAPALVARAVGPGDPAPTPGAESESEEARRFRKMLEDNHAISPPGAPLAPGTTHVVEVGPDGKPKIERKRYSLT